ncbi:hypothetical protein H6X66_11555, partial [Actinomyces sp. AC-18-1]|nr:hypothetical protein [Actinomyces sp. 187325]
MSQAQAELVARATDPHAELTTLHTLAQNYPGLRPYIAENPRTYPALLEWLGSLGDPAVDAALARRAAGAVGTAGPVGPVSAAEAGGEATTQMLPTGAGAAVSPTQATVALPVQQPSAPQQTQAYPPHQPYAAYQGAQAPGQYRPGGPGPQGTAAAAMGTTGAAVATGPLGAPAWAQRPAQGEQGVFGVGQAEEEPAGHGGTVWLWVLGAVALVLVVALTVWFLMGGADRPAAPSPEA